MLLNVQIQWDLYKLHNTVLLLVNLNNIKKLVNKKFVKIVVMLDIKELQSLVMNYHNAQINVHMMKIIVRH